MGMVFLIVLVIARSVDLVLGPVMSKALMLPTGGDLGTGIFDVKAFSFKFN